MPFLNGFFISNKEIEKDEKFLQDQGLSKEQISSVSIYFQERIAGKGNYTAIFLMTFFVIIGSISYHIFLNHQKEQDNQRLEEDRKRLCIQNPFLP